MGMVVLSNERLDLLIGREVIMNIVRYDEPLKNGICDECNHCLKIKRTQFCDASKNKNDKYIRCREMMVCGKFSRSYSIEGQ